MVECMRKFYICYEASKIL